MISSRITCIAADFRELTFINTLSASHCLESLNQISFSSLLVSLASVSVNGLGPSCIVFAYSNRRAFISSDQPVAAGRGGHPPRAALCRGGRHLEGQKIWNFEIWPLLANWRLHCRTGSAGSLV